MTYDYLKKNAHKTLFLLAVKSNSVILFIMKVKELKIRKPILFTKARPFKMKNKILPRKQKHKEQV